MFPSSLLREIEQKNKNNAEEEEEEEGGGGEKATLAFDFKSNKTITSIIERPY